MCRRGGASRPPRHGRRPRMRRSSWCRPGCCRRIRASPTTGSGSRPQSSGCWTRRNVAPPVAGCWRRCSVRLGGSHLRLGRCRKARRVPSPTILRDSVAGLVAYAAADLDTLWAGLVSADQAREALMDVLPALVDTYGSAAGTVAADWYDDTRLEQEIRGRFTASPAVLRDPGTDELTRWGLSPLFGENPDWSAARTLVLGGLQRRIKNVGRETVMGSSIQDPQADGWQRIAQSDACLFCQMLAGRGDVYGEETTADFAAHDWCSCEATVAWRNRPKPVRKWTGPSPDRSRADYDRAREWIATNM